LEETIFWLDRTQESVEFTELIAR